MPLSKAYNLLYNCSCLHATSTMKVSFKAWSFPLICNLHQVFAFLYQMTNRPLLLEKPHPKQTCSNWSNGLGHLFLCVISIYLECKKMTKCIWNLLQIMLK